MAAQPNILQLLDHPEAFGPHFKGETWRAWRAFLAALFALPMDDEAVGLYQRHTGRHTQPDQMFREAALICGRRGGKSRVLALIATFLAGWGNYEPHLAPGEMATVAVIAADRRQARGIFRYITGLLRSVPYLARMIEDEQTESVTLSNRVVIEIHTASFRVTRGYTLAAALCDEVAFWRTDDSAVPDMEILAALRPGLASIPGSMLLLASSPYAKRGALYGAFRRHYAQDGARVLVWKGGTAEMNPSIDPAIIEEATEEDPEKAAAEYGGDFRSDIAAFVSRETVDACVVPGRRELLPVPGVQYLAFADPSGGSSDSMTIAIAHQQDDVAVLDAVREIRPPFSPEAAVTEFAGLLKAYRLSEVTGDRYAGEWPRERFRVAGISYRISEPTKGDIYRDTLPLLNSGKLELLDVPRLVTQLCGLERRTARGGRDSIDHGPGAHDDVANAVAGALLLCKARAPMRISDEAVALARTALRQYAISRHTARGF